MKLAICFLLFFSLQSFAAPTLKCKIEVQAEGPKPHELVATFEKDLHDFKNESHNYSYQEKKEKNDPLKAEVVFDLSHGDQKDQLMLRLHFEALNDSARAQHNNQSEVRFSFLPTEKSPFALELSNPFGITYAHCSMK